MAESSSSNKSKQSKSRREVVRRAVRAREKTVFQRVMQNPASVPSFLIVMSFVALSTLLVVWAQRATVLPTGRIADRTTAVRVEFQVLDALATERERERRRDLAPRVYQIDSQLIEDLRTSFATLPQILAAAESLEQVVPEVREAFALTADQFMVVREQVVEGEASAEWKAACASLYDTLRVTPFLTNSEFQTALAEDKRLELRLADGTARDSDTKQIVDIGNDSSDRVLALVQRAGFTGVLAQVAAQRLVTLDRPTYIHNKEATVALREKAAANVAKKFVTHRPGETITVRGIEISELQANLARVEAIRFRESQSVLIVVLRSAALAGLIFVMTAALAVYTATSYPRIARNPWRVFALCALVLCAAALSIWPAVRAPEFLWFSLSASAGFVTMMIVVAYGPRFAVVTTSFVLAIASVAAAIPILTLIAVGVGAFVAAWTLRDVRNRSDLVRTGVYAGGTLALACAISSVLGRPLVRGVWEEILIDCLQAGFGGFFAGGFTLVILPSVERVFDITTGMSLSEWRDPKQPLLRLLQQRAPGSYNHSLTVASIAEAAADSIGADALHLYVGALYHDIGKMNKPGYFVENQSGQSNKHENLSPAMSLLVIVGHVKDGLELAREYNLPRSLHHYIEAHHGTTLVEYFYDAAKKQADESGLAEAPEEIEYRYPGPRPHTREAAILMISDAVESATRAMSEPTPSRIGTLVHAIARKRLVDGQFDECDLTLRELRAIEDSIIKSLCAIYHGRIAYPTDMSVPKDEAKDKRTQESAEQSA